MCFSLIILRLPSVPGAAAGTFAMRRSESNIGFSFAPGRYQRCRPRGSRRRDRPASRRTLGKTQHAIDAAARKMAARKGILAVIRPGTLHFRPTPSASVTRAQATPDAQRTG